MAEPGGDDAVSGAPTSEPGTVSVIVFVVLASGSLTDVTIRVSVVTALALVALLVIGWRQPARTGRSAPRRMPEPAGVEKSHRSVGTNDPSGTNDPTGTNISTSERWARRALDAFGLGAISLIAGVLLAIVVALAISTIVTNVVDRL